MHLQLSTLEAKFHQALLSNQKLATTSTYAQSTYLVVARSDIRDPVPHPSIKLQIPRFNGSDLLGWTFRIF